jgi:hypothetical protein
MAEGVIEETSDKSDAGGAGKKASEPILYSKEIEI